MKNLIRALSVSVVDMFHPRILMLMFVPPILALLFWGTVAFLLWPSLMAVAGWMMSWAPDFLQATSGFIAVILAIGMVLPLALVSVLLFVSVLAMPFMVSHVSKNYFPTLEKRSQGNMVASFKNAIWTSFKYLVMWFLTLPLWLVPGLNIAVPLVLNAYLNYKIFLYDALGEHASLTEIKHLVDVKRSEFYVLGLITAVLMITPIVFLVAPFYAGLSFTHMAMSELRDLRSEQKSRAL